jgi:MFS family permease
MAILSSFGAEEREKYIGWIEAAFGLGMLFGPLLGAVMYNYGGYQCPFITFTIIYFLSYPYISWSLIQANRERVAAVQDENDSTLIQPTKIVKEKIQLRHLFAKPRFTFGIMC